MNKKNKIAAFLLFFTFLLLSYSFYLVEKRVDTYLIIHEDLTSVVILNKELDVFIEQKLQYRNFDIIDSKISQLNEKLKRIKKENIEKFTNTNNENSLYTITSLMNKKVEYIQRVKSSDAIMNNSFRFLQDIFVNEKKVEYLSLYTTIMTVPYNVEIDLQNEIDLLDEKDLTDPFLKHSKIFFEYYLSNIIMKKKIYELNLVKKLNVFSLNFDRNASTLINKLFTVVYIISILFMILLGFFLRNSHNLYIKQVELNRFKKAVESSDNIIVITDKDKRITYVNKTFEESTGYTLDEIKGEKPSMFKGNLKENEFYKKLNEDIYSGKTWKGEFINKNRKGEYVYEKASITPIFDEDGEITEFLAIKLDISEEIEIQKKLKEKEYLLSQQSKMIALGEMLESIAHQWRQPLSTISTAASGLKVNKEFESLSDQQFEEYTDVIITSTEYLSKVIDNFKDFFRTNNTLTIFYLGDTIEKIMNLIAYKLNDKKIEFFINSEEVKCEGLENELIQGISNIISNSKDAFLEKTGKKYIFIDIKKTSNNMAIIKIKDNAGGIDPEIIDHIFEPYFTTKDKSQGTGLGLYMTYEIIVKHFHGIINVRNLDFTYENELLTGSEVIIQIPVNKEESC